MNAPVVRDADACPHSRVLDASLLCEILQPGNDPSLPLRCSIAHAIVGPGEHTLQHRLRRSTEVYYILAGDGEVCLGGERVAVHTGTAVVIPPGIAQCCRNTGSVDLVFLEIVDPAGIKRGVLRHTASADRIPAPPLPAEATISG